MSSRQCVRFFVSGRVQGVFYRSSTVSKARRLGLIGWARNLHDGRVEIVACGEPDALEALQVWLWQGPSSAQVAQVESNSENADIAESLGEDFRVAGDH